MVELRLPDRDDLGVFVARAVRLEPSCVVRLRAREGGGHVEAWVATPFDVLATRAVAGAVEPADVTVSGNELLAALTVARGERIDPGPPQDLLWRSPLPPSVTWLPVDTLPVREVAGLADSGAALARDNAGPKGTPPTSLLDHEVLTVEGSGLTVKVPLRCLFALTGMGFLPPEAASAPNDHVRVSATDSWLRIDARYGAVARRRHALLPLLM